MQNRLGTFFHTSWHFSTHFHTSFQSFSEHFLLDFFLELRGFTTVLVLRNERRIKERKKREKDQTISHVSCTFVLLRNMAPCDPEFVVEFWATKVLSPGFWGRILGSIFLVLCFPTKRDPIKNHPQEIHCPKVTSRNSPQGFGLKNSHCTSAGAFCWLSSGYKKSVPLPQKIHLHQKHLEGYYDISVWSIVKNPFELFARELRKFCVTQHGRICRLGSNLTQNNSWRIHFR